MHDLIHYEAVVYDANCIIYFCFEIRESDRDGRVVLLRDPETERTRRITDRLIHHGKSVLTIRRVWIEAEKILPGKALDELIKRGIVQNGLKLKGAVPPDLKLRMARSLRLQLADLQLQAWFSVNSTFRPPIERIGAIRTFFAQLAADPANWPRIPPYKGEPSDADLELILFSAHVRAPLVTNDREMYNFAPELKAAGFCEMIKGLPYVVV